MENLRIVKSFLILLGGMLLLFVAIPFFLIAYDDNTTHPALTDEIVDHFIRFYPEYEISASQKELIKLGSIEEDSGTRWLQHFYDPIKNRGLVFGNDDLLRNPELAAIIGGSRSEWQSSKEWAQNTSMQAGLFGGSAYGSIFSFFSSQSDFSWERAVYEYAWGDKNRAMLALGHILHLIEDVSVPDHTRNDPHPHVTEWFSTLNESPYEIWTRKFTPGNFTASINASPIILGSLNEYFDSMARYSNGNFFSKDTILRNYELPKISSEKSERLKNGRFYTFGFNDEYRLVRIEKEFDVKSGEFVLDYTLNDPDNLILTDYWSHLSRQAILHGAGVMKLFFDEVAREQQTKTLYNKNRSWWQKAGDGIAGIWAGFTNNTSSSAGLLATVNPAVIEVSPPAGGETSTTNDAIEVSPPDGGETSTTTGGGASDETKIEVSPPVGGETSVTMGGETLTTANPPLVFSSGGGSSRSRIEVSPPAGGETSPTAGGETSAPTLTDTIPPDAPVITAPTETTQTTSRITFSGTAEAGTEIFTDFDDATTTVIEVSPPAGGETSPTAGGETSPATGTWALALNLPQGTTTINFFAKDSTGNISTGTQKTIFVDSEKPDIAFSIAECAASLAQDGCLMATTTVSLAWVSNAPDLASYSLSCAKDGNNPCTNFSYEPNATATIFIAENNHTYIFTATARDTAGNESSETQSVEIQTSPVIINEIAWAGTYANEQDEWIELKNNSNAAINLSGWRLYSETDAKPDIALSGVIPANGYYLIERTDDNTVSDIAADWTGSFGAIIDGGSGISNIGETFILAYGSTTIDQTPARNICGRRRWCAGDGASRATMERVDPLIAGTNQSNWFSNNGIIKTGKDAANNPISGTPKARNSANFDIERLWRAYGEPQTLTLPQAVYMINSDGFTVHAGKTLMLEPGAIIKFVSANEPSLWVSGTLKAEGTVESPVVFTSMYDDEYGGDTNGDGICNPANASSTALCPNPGSWKQIYISPDSVNTTIDHAIIRYGGKWFHGMSFRAMLAVDRAAVELKNSVVEHSWGHGLYAANSDATIENNIFRRNASHEGDLGFLIGGGSSTIRGNSSSYNSVGGTLSGVGGVFSDNAFTNNTREALMLSGAMPAMANLSASGNGINGIFLQSVPPNFIFQAGLPYIIENQSILSSGSYSFEPGAVIKFKTSSAALTFSVPVNIAGTGASPIVFTSIYDDGYGGDTNNDGVCNPADASSTAACPSAGDWGGLQFLAGANGATLNNVIVRYGGSRAPWAGIKADGAAIAISNSVIEHNYRKGIFLQVSATTTITDTIIRNHTKPENNPEVSGLYLAGSHADIGGLTFRDNTVGINAPDALVGGSSITVTGPIDIDTSNIIPTIPSGLAP